MIVYRFIVICCVCRFAIVVWICVIGFVAFGGLFVVGGGAVGVAGCL